MRSGEPALRVCEFLPTVILSAERRSRTESKEPTQWQRRWLRELFHDTVCDGLWSKICRRMWHRTQTWGASTAPRLRSARQASRKSIKSQTLSEVEGDLVFQCISTSGLAVSICWLV